ncbi:protein-methionine-sulfoxide reductase heme-binding subunit MsrQ [Thalassotalea aquiviva]|uniref:protein-methionine-sulfoxide reductase heme-binding subunit MsrQ n=1 Tax=Thalassotalea aquiviva TaxID=3242415 RepID=UPI003529FCB0
MLKALIHFSALLPAVIMYYLAILDRLGADPVEQIIHFTGISGLNVLLLTLSVTPLAKTFRQGWLMQVRRLLGLYGFFYACLHILSFLFFELQFDFSLFIDEVIKRPYISIGMLAFILLLALAITSLNPLKRLMGKRWQWLHNFNYLLVALVCIHFYWSVKSAVYQPLLYIAILLGLLWFRKDKFQRWFQRTDKVKLADQKQSADKSIK